MTNNVTLFDLPQNIIGDIGSRIENPARLERVSRNFRDHVVVELYRTQIQNLLGNTASREAMQRFHLTPSLDQLKHPLLEKVKSAAKTCLSFTRLNLGFISQALRPSYVDPKTVYRTLYKDLQVLKSALEKDVPREDLPSFSVGQMISDPRKLADYLDSAYLSGIQQVVSVISTNSPTAQQMMHEITPSEPISPSAAVQKAFELAKRDGAKIASELEGQVLNIRRHLFDTAQTSWGADPTFYPHEFTQLLQSSTVRFEDLPRERSVRQKVSHCLDRMVNPFAGLNNEHKEYCYCRYSPNVCKKNRVLTWTRISPPAP